MTKYGGSCERDRRQRVQDRRRLAEQPDTRTGQESLRALGANRSYLHLRLWSLVLDSGYKRADRITYWRRAAAPATASPSDPGGDSRKEALRMSPNSPRWLAAAALVFSVIVSACGSSSGTPSAATAALTTASPAVATIAASTAATAAIPSPAAATTAAASCPTAATVGASLGITVSNPIGVAGGGGAQLPPGATGVACDYSGTGLNVII